MSKEAAVMLGLFCDVDDRADEIVVLVRGLFGSAVTFAVENHRYVAVAQQAWLDGRDAISGNTQLLSRVAGRITIAGERHVVLDCTADLEPPNSHPSMSQLLTRRELQIAMLVSEGGGDKDIARRLGISSYTVREHMRRIFNKLGVSKRSAVVAHVLSAGSDSRTTVPNFRAPVEITTPIG